MLKVMLPAEESTVPCTRSGETGTLGSVSASPARSLTSRCTAAADVDGDVAEPPQPAAARTRASQARLDIDPSGGRACSLAVHPLVQDGSKSVVACLRVV